MLDVKMKDNKKDLLKRFRQGVKMEVEELKSIIEIYSIQWKKKGCIVAQESVRKAMKSRKLVFEEQKH